MKEEYEHYKSIRIIEYAMVIIVLLVVLIILFPALSKIIYNMSKEAAITNTKDTIDTVKATYTDMNLINEVALPFKVVFNKDGYEFYEMNKKVNYKRTFNIDFEGRLPSSGSVEITTDGTVTVKDLTFGSIKCNQVKEQNLICDKK